MSNQPEINQFAKHIQQTVQVFSKSLFLISFTALILVIVTSTLLIGHDFSSLSISHIIAIVVIVLVAFIVWKLLRTEPTRLIPLSRRAVRIFANPFLNFIIIAVLVETGVLYSRLIIDLMQEESR